MIVTDLETAMAPCSLCGHPYKTHSLARKGYWKCSEKCSCDQFTDRDGFPVPINSWHRDWE
jgi:hypothetical protein